MSDVCPKCGLRFSDWFHWIPGLRYCWPCYQSGGFVEARCEDGSVRSSYERPYFSDSAVKEP